MLDRLPPGKRQIVDLLYAGGQATVAEIARGLSVALSASAVRAMRTPLEAKGFVTRRASDRGFVFAPAVSENAARESALQQIMRTFSNGASAVPERADRHGRAT